MKVYKDYRFKFFKENGESVVKCFSACTLRVAWEKAGNWAYFNEFVDFIREK